MISLQTHRGLTHRRRLGRPFPALMLAGAIAVSLTALCPAAQAQLLDQLKNAAGAGQDTSGGGMLGGLGGLGGSGGGIPSVEQASPSNTAGVLQYCLRNNFLGGGGASSVKDSLLGRLNQSGGANNSDFKSGNNGVLETGNGQNFSLGGNGLKAQITNKVCELILQHAKSLF